MTEQEMKEYWNSLTTGLEKAMGVAKQARSKNFDPENFIEIIPAEDVAGRVEGIVGPEGIAEKIRKMEKEFSREILAFAVVKEIINNKEKYGLSGDEEIVDQAVRTGVGILTEGVLVAPTEGISKLKIRENPDGSRYVSIYFAGPIRSAGATVAALSVALADYARQQLNIADYRPTDTEVERYVEEIHLYDVYKRLQYKPTEDEIRLIVRNCPVCIDGDPTEEAEVSVHKNLERVETDRIRGGIALVIGEGIAQKAAKVLKYTKKVGINWSWLEGLIKVAKKDGKVTEIKPNKKFLGDLVAGRPIFAYPSMPGAFRLRYGRTRMTGIASKAFHPAAMTVSDDFIAIGTQLKVERPGKGCIATPCDSIDGPVVKLKSGEVLQLETREQAEKLREELEEVLFFGDLLVTFGDFHKSNHPLVPSGYCEEYWLKQLAKAAEEKGKAIPKVNAREISADDAFKIAKDYGVPLAPRHTFFWHDLTPSQFGKLGEWLASGSIEQEWFKLKGFKVKNSEEKRILELLCVPHKLEGEFVVLEPEKAVAVLRTMGLLDGKSLKKDAFDKAFSEEKTVMEMVNELAGVTIRKKAPTYIGGRMGRPEKAKERMMKPAPHVLFPIGEAGGKVRSIIKAYRKAKERERYAGEGLRVQVARLKCPSCDTIHITNKCPSCGAKTVPERICPRCGKTVEGEKCLGCNYTANEYDMRAIKFTELMDQAIDRCKGLPDEMKGVKGMISDAKIPEPLEKGILRARHGVYVFRDGTIRFDATDAPLTHFYPREIGVSVERLKELGYTHDAEGKELVSGDQLLELKPQDILLADRGAEYFLQVSKFVDDLLVYLYGLPPYYNAESREDLLGELFITIAPHTSCGVLGRLIGFTHARVGYAHPYTISARRRNADGDEDGAMLLLDALVNFSKKFLPGARGGHMDAALVMTTLINPSEIDDEAHSMEACKEYPLELYEAAERFASPSEVKIERVKDRLGTPEQNFNLHCTHSASDINDGPIETRYVQLGSMKEKVESQMELYSRIRAVDREDAAERVISSHFLPDLYGNLRAFSRQTLRCVDCNQKYRRAPLSGKCRRCGGKLVLTISRGSISKYLEISQQMTEKYSLPNYLKQRLKLLEKEINSIFEDETNKQFSLAEFM